MKVYLNLAHTPTPRERYAFTWTIPVIAVALIGLMWLVGTGIRDFQSLRVMRRSFAGVQNRDTQLLNRERKLQQELGRPDVQQVVHKTKFVNQLIGQKQFALTEFMVKVAKLLPPSVRLNGLGLSAVAATPIVQFSVLGKDDDAIESFLDNLENSDDFGDVIVKSQGVQQGNTNQASQQIALVCTARYLTGFSSSGK